MKNSTFLKKLKTRSSLSILCMLSVLWLVSSISLSAEVVKEHYSVERWLDFEPGEEFTIKGNQFLVTNFSTVQYYKGSSDMVKAEKSDDGGDKNGDSSQNSSSSNSGKDNSDDESGEPKPNRIWSELHGGSENALGIRASWDRIGSHYLDIIPPNKNKIKEIGLNGIDEMSLWVWSGNYDHELDLVFTRRGGEQVAITLTKLNFLGWQKVRVKIPNRLKVFTWENRLFDEREFHFDRFRIYTANGERVSNVYIFLDNFEVRRDLNDSEYFDGKYLVPVIKKELADEAKEKEEGNNQ